MQTCDDVRRLATSIDGWLSDAQGCALFQAAAAATGRGSIVEIGSWKGRSTAWLAAGARLSGAKVYAVDPHTGSREDPHAATLAEFRTNLARAGLADHVEPLVMTSAEAARVVESPIELLFIDGDHAYRGRPARRRVVAPETRRRRHRDVPRRGTAGYSGPRRVFRRSICWNAGFERIERVGSMTMARRTRRRSFGSAAWGLFAGVLLYLYDVKRLVRGVARRAATTRGQRAKE